MCSNYINATQDNHINMFAKFIKLLFEVKEKSKSRQAKQHPTHIWFITSVG
jgi:hypothetical protein